MSTTITFDTYGYVKKLRDAGVDERQAEIQAEALIALVEDRLATKQDMISLKRDLADVEANLRKDMAAIDAGLKRDLAAVEANLKRDIREMDVKAETRFRELDVKAETRFRELDVKAETRFRELDGKAETRFRELDGKIETTKIEILAKVDAKIESAKVDTIKWTAGMFVAQTALILGAMFAVMKMNQPSSHPPGYHTPPAQEMRLPAFPPPSSALPVQPPVSQTR